MMNLVIRGEEVKVEYKCSGLVITIVNANIDDITSESIISELVNEQIQDAVEKLEDEIEALKAKK
jgi:hypothetical protein